MLCNKHGSLLLSSFFGYNDLTHHELTVNRVKKVHNKYVFGTNNRSGTAELDR